MFVRLSMQLEYKKIPDHDNIYKSDFVTSLFDEMSKTYGVVNSLSSFGFCIWWRQKCAKMIEFNNGDQIVDLMSGMAELSVHVARRVEEPAEIVAIDLSSEMNKRARSTIARKKLRGCRVLQADALKTALPDASVDAVVSTFGLKTFSESQIRSLARELKRILKPGGRIAFLEISVPKFRLLRVPYMFYLRNVIPVLGRMLMGNPENYRMLGIYTEQFGNCDQVIQIFRDTELDVDSRSFFFGCATGFCGRKQTV